MKGTIYGIFKVEEKDGQVVMVKNVINHYFFWLFEILNEIEGLACLCLGIPHRFIIRIQREDSDIKPTSKFEE